MDAQRERCDPQCQNQHAINMLEADRDNIVDRLNTVIRDQSEMGRQLSVLMERVPSNLKEQLTNIQGAVETHNKFRAQVYNLVLAIITSFALALVAWVVAGGMKVTR